MDTDVVGGTRSKRETALHQMLTNAVAYTRDELSPLRAKATDYYAAEPYGNEEPGRSQVVTTEVRDTVLGYVPQVMRIVFGSDAPVEFQPTSAMAADKADEMTAFIRKAIEDRAFLQVYNVLQDGAVRKLGIFKWMWEEKKREQEFAITDANILQVQQLQDDPGATITEVTGSVETGFEVRFTRSEEVGVPVVESVPPNEFIFSREARSLDTAPLVGHRTFKTKAELLDMGISAEVIEEFGGEGKALRDDSDEVLARESVAGNESGGVHTDDGGQGSIEYVEAFVLLPKGEDGEGGEELRRICTLGPGYHIVVDEEADERPFAVFCPVPEPHTMSGFSIAVLAQSMQLTTSSLVRGMLDSLAGAIFPRMAAVEGKVNMQDLLNTAIGSPIRIKDPQAITTITTPFVGREVLPVLLHMQEMLESRTGLSKGAAALDADALQSTTPTGVTAAVSSAQLRADLIARIFCEQALRPLFRGLARLFVKHQPKGQVTRLRGRWVDVDPSTFDPDLSVTVNVALGRASKQERFALLTSVKQTQEQALMTFGPVNDLTDIGKYYNTLSDLLALGEYVDPDRYFSAPDVEQIKQRMAMAQQQPKQTPEAILAEAQKQIEQAKLQQKAAQEQQELQHRAAWEQQALQQKAALEEERAIAEARKADREAALRMFELRQQDERERARAEAEIALAREKMQMEQETKLAIARLQADAKASAPEAS